MHTNGGLAHLGGPEDPMLYDPEFVEQLSKALTAGSDINNPGAGAGEGFPLRLEALDSVLFSTTYEEKHLRFFQSLPKGPATNTIMEFNRLLERGSGNAVWMAEGDLPSEDDSTYERAYTQIKFMGTVRRVSHVLTTLKTAHGDAVAREARNGTVHLLRQLESHLFHADSSLMPLQFDGLEKSLISAWGNTVEADGQLSGWGDTNAIDARGGSLSEDLTTDLADRLVNGPNYGAPNALWSPTGPIKDLSKTMYPKERTTMGERGIVGTYAERVRTPFGDIRLEPDIFIEDSPKADPNGVGRPAERPNTPTLAAPTSPVYAQTKFGATDAGDYIYKIVAVNKYGKSAPATSAAVTVASGDEVRIDVTSANDTDYFEVYRTPKDEAAGEARLIFKVKRTAATQTIRDINRFLPGTSKAYMLTQTPDVMKWLQLLPYTRMPLAQIDTSIRFMLLLYGSLQVMAPRKNGIIYNLGKLQTGAYAP